MKLDVIMRAILNGEDEETVNELFQDLNAERTKVMLTQGSGDDPDFLSLTKDQIRLLGWLSDHCYLDCCEWSIFDEIEVEEV